MSKTFFILLMGLVPLIGLILQLDYLEGKKLTQYSIMVNYVYIFLILIAFFLFLVILSGWDIEALMAYQKKYHGYITTATTVTRLYIEKNKKW